MSVEAAPGWHWRCLWRAPHRLAFAAATALLLSASLWWLLLLAGRASIAAWTGLVLVPALAHGAVMVFGFFPLFFAGFIFTVGPKWLRVAGPAPRAIAWAVLPQLAGWLIWLAAGHLGAAPAATGILLALTGLLVQYGRLTVMWLVSRAADRIHAGLIALAGGIGIVSLTGLLASLLQDDFGLARVWVQTGLWGFAFLTFAAAAHRMVPVLSSDHLPGPWHDWSVLGLLLGCAAVKVGLAWSGPAGAAAAAFDAFSGAGLLLVACALFWIACIWARVPGRGMRMMTMLRAGLVWLALAFLLDGASILGQWAGWRLSSLAALHACAMGFMATIMLAMVERVSCAYGGRKLAFEGWVWSAFWLLQLATLMRVASELAFMPLPAVALLLAASLWLLAWLPWCLRLLRWYGSPRPDGRPG